MSRGSAGTYGLPLDPFVSGTIVRASDFNTQFADIANALTDSLSRTGLGGMQAPLRLDDGSAGLPALAFTNDPGVGLYSGGTGIVRMVGSAATLQEWRTTGVTIYPATTVDDTLTVTGACALQTTLAVTGNTTLSGTLAVTGATTLTGALTANDPVTVNAPITVVSDAGRGVTATGAAGNEGLRAIAGTAATATNSANALGVVNGYIGFGATNPNSNVAFQNTLTPSNIPKAYAKVTTTGGGGVTVNGGFNLTAAINGSNVRFTFPVGATLANADYTLELHGGNSVLRQPQIVTQTTGYFEVALYVMSNDGGGNLIATQLDLAGIIETLHVVVHGLQ